MQLKAQCRASPTKAAEANLSVLAIRGKIVAQGDDYTILAGGGGGGNTGIEITPGRTTLAIKARGGGC